MVARSASTARSASLLKSRSDCPTPSARQSQRRRHKCQHPGRGGQPDVADLFGRWLRDETANSLLDRMTAFAYSDRYSRLGQRSPLGHKERFLPPRLSDGFSIAANVKPRPSTHIARRLALRLTCHTGLSLLFEVGVRPPHDGMSRMGRSNLSGAVATD